MTRDLIKLNAELDSGITPSIKQSDVPFWRDGLNVAFTGSAIRPIFPQRDVTFTLSADPIRGRILETRISGAPYAFFGDHRHLYRFDGTTVTDVSRAVGGLYNGLIDQTLVKPATMWSFAQWGNWVFAAQENDFVQKYSGTGVFANLDTSSGAGGFVTASIIVAYKSFLVAFNTTMGADFVHWCSSDNTNVWDPALGGSSAGFLQARDAGPILAACLFRGNVVFATAKSLHILRFVGAPNWFGQDILIDNVGVAGKDCLIPIGSSLYGLNDDGIWVSDGVTAKQLDEPAMHDFFVGKLNQDQSSKMHLWYNLAENHVEAHFPTIGTEPDLVITRREDNALWSILDRAVTATSPGQVFPFALTGTANGRLMGQTKDDSGELHFDGSDITAGGGQAKPGPVSMEEQIFMHVGYGDGGYGEVGYGGFASVGSRPDSVALLWPFGYTAFAVDNYGNFVFTLEAWYEEQRPIYNNHFHVLFTVGTVVVGMQAGVVLCKVGGVTQAAIPDIMPPGVWYTWTLDCAVSIGAFRLFRDGVLQASFTGPVGLGPTDDVIWGKSGEPTDDLFQGFVREIAIVSRLALHDTGVVDNTYFTDPEKLKAKIKELYEIGAAELFNYWPLDGELLLTPGFWTYIDYGSKHLALNAVVGPPFFISAPSPEFNALRLTGRATSDATIIMIQTNAAGDKISFGVGGIDLRSAFVESKYLDGEDPRLSKHIFNVISEVEGRPLEDPLQLTILLKNTLDQKVPIAVTLDMDKPTLKKKIKGAKYIAFRIEDPSVDKIWRLTKMFANATPGGSRIK